MKDLCPEAKAQIATLIVETVGSNKKVPPALLDLARKFGLRDTLINELCLAGLGLRDGKKPGQHHINSTAKFGN